MIDIFKCEDNWMDVKEYRGGEIEYGIIKSI